MPARRPLSFTLDDAGPGARPAPAPPGAAPHAPEAPPTAKEERQQVGARIRVKTYRQLKARAALEGRKVQELVELAVERYLAEPDG